MDIWKIGKLRTNSGAIPIVTENSRVCLVDSDNGEAHARLIASAPALLETLEETARFLMSKARRDPDEREIVEAVRSAIAAAKGTV